MHDSNARFGSEWLDQPRDARRRFPWIATPIRPVGHEPFVRYELEDSRGPSGDVPAAVLIGPAVGISSTNVRLDVGRAGDPLVEDRRVDERAEHTIWWRINHD